MTTPTFPPARHGDLEAAVVFGEIVELRLGGSSDARAAVGLREIIERLHATVCDANVKEVVVDMVALEFMAASSFNVFVAWLGLINDLAPERRYRLRFKSNENIRWQRRSLHTLSCFATDLVLLGDAA